MSQLVFGSGGRIISWVDKSSIKNTKGLIPIDDFRFNNESMLENSVISFYKAIIDF